MNERIRILIPQDYKPQKPEYETICIPLDKNIPLFKEAINMGYSYTQLRRGGGHRNKDSEPVWVERILTHTEYAEDNNPLKIEYHALCSLEEAREIFHSRNDDVNDWPDGTFDFLLDSENQPLYDTMAKERIYKNVLSESELELLSEDTKAESIKRGLYKNKVEKNRKIREKKKRKETDAREEKERKEKQEEERQKRISQASSEELAKYGLNANGEPYFS